MDDDRDLRFEHLLRVVLIVAVIWIATLALLRIYVEARDYFTTTPEVSRGDAAP